MSTPEDAAVRRFYDEETTRKLRDYVAGNRRVERASALLWEQTRDRAPRRVLEIGSGIGQLSDAMARRWPSAQVVGLDISPRSVELASRLFSRPNLTYVTGKADEAQIEGSFDLIVMIDTYEHIHAVDRPQLLQQMARLAAADVTVVTTSPTPRFLDWLRRHNPDEIQPVDEEITLTEIQLIADAVGGEVTQYRLVDVWRERDYSHAVVRGLPRASEMPDVPRREPTGARAWLEQLVGGGRHMLAEGRERQQRRTRVRERLGIDVG